MFCCAVLHLQDWLVLQAVSSECMVCHTVYGIYGIYTGLPYAYPVDLWLVAQVEDEMRELLSVMEQQKAASAAKVKQLANILQDMQAPATQ